MQRELQLEITHVQISENVKINRYNEVNSRELIGRHGAASSDCPPGKLEVPSFHNYHENELLCLPGIESSGY